ncbi:MAG: carboxypeptidase-like regulatory domain-containing protein, partial [Muribaculaceae bacterium]|nr:carboxypeptidase-like regulatory domain-containing protein [Muribaculaceae bacterium]
MKQYILALILCICGVGVTFSQVQISGKITDDKDEPIEFATIRVQGTALGTNSNLKGEYSLTVAQRDTLVVEVSCLGYANVVRQYIKPKGKITLNAKLYQKSKELGELEVVEIRRQTDQMQTIDAQSMRLTPDASGGSVEAVLSTMAGVSSKNEMSSQYMVRGGS